MAHETFFKPAEGTAYLKRRQAKHLARMDRDKKARSIDRQKQNAEAEIRLAVWVRDKGHCRSCGTEVRHAVGFLDTMHSHHVIWLSRGGWDGIDNECATCNPCHKAIHAERLDCEGDPNGDLTFRSYTFNPDQSRELIRSWVSPCPRQE